MFAAKVSCRRLYNTGGSLHGIARQLTDNPWEVYLTKAWTEDPRSEKLLCSICRTRQPREHFIGERGASVETDPAATRCCINTLKHSVAIELGQSRLSTRTIGDALRHIWYQPQCDLPLPPGSTVFPSPAFQNGLSAGLVMNEMSFIQPPLQCPFSFSSGQDDIPSYSVQQKFAMLADRVYLACRVRLRQLPFNDSFAWFYTPSDPSAALPTSEPSPIPMRHEELNIRQIQEFFATLPSSGGLWACPHIFMASLSFCRRLYNYICELHESRRRDNLQSANGNTSSGNRDIELNSPEKTSRSDDQPDSASLLHAKNAHIRCKFCRTRIKFTGDQVNVPRRGSSGPDITFTLNLEILKNLGPIGNIVDGNGDGSGNGEFRRHLSRRIAASLEKTAAKRNPNDLREAIIRHHLEARPPKSMSAWRANTFE